MANEAAIRERSSNPLDIIDFIVADGTGIEKGTILKITDPRTAAASDGAADFVAGIAAREKVANDGRTRLAVHRRGIFDVYASGAIAVGDAVVTDSMANHVKSAAGDLSGAKRLGFALETATTGEVIQVELNIGETNA